MSNKDTRDEDLKYQFNEGRINADRKWCDAIDRRIAELEAQVGIPELRRLKKMTSYKWSEKENEKEYGKRRNE